MLHGKKKPGTWAGLIVAGLLIPDEATCLECHNEQSPTYREFDFEKRWAEIAHPYPSG